MAKSQQLTVFDAVSGNSFIQQVLPRILKNKDILLAVAVLMVITFLIVPLPPALLDVFLTISLGLSVLILVISIYIRKPLDFSSFPTVLLIATLYRLGLNVASTRLILGSGEPGRIIEAFGAYVMGGNYVVGLIIFIILLIINFVVVIKGSTRIAEVSARFTLDAMPGKQMSIDADLNSGFIDEVTARTRRENLSNEADFYGSMDGAAKFVKGDAIAGLIITAINIIGGFAVGVLQMDMEVAEAASRFTILSVGDGLVSQIPSLLISVASGMVVTRAAGTDELSSQLANQFTLNPKPLAITGAMLIALGLLPGFPTAVFMFIGLSLLALAYFRYGSNTKDAEAEAAKAIVENETMNAEAAQQAETPVEGLLKIDPLEIELGYSLISLVDEAQGGDVFKRITNIRKQLASELGILLPPVRVRDNLSLEPEDYVFKIRNNEVSRSKIYPQMILAMNSGLAEGVLDGIEVIEPVFGLPATWIGTNNRENAEVMGYTVVEAATVLTTHFTEILKQNASKLLTRQDVRKLVDNLKEDYPVLLEELVAENLPISLLQKILQSLLTENIPIRDLPMIIEAVLEYSKVTKNVEVLTEYVRHNLSEIIKKLYADNNGVVHCIALSPVVEDKLTTSLQANAQNSMSVTLGLPPDVVQAIQDGLSIAIDDITVAGYLPTVICSAQIRPYFYRMIHSAQPMVSVISYTELPADTDIEVHSRVDI
ncbi:MAG: flagellar biosynthesis protein FlhA [Ignavibacteria bacterium]|jgi:flagellar biosynthesis protein FlhA|nr:flagellar biosynthesis protein FlhA [Ignavibacteria bacterium]